MTETMSLTPRPPSDRLRTPGALLAMGAALLAAFGARSAPAQESPSTTTRVAAGLAAIVGAEAISQGELDERVARQLANQEKPISPRVLIALKEHLRRQFLDYLIEQSLLLQEAKRLGITATEDEILFGVNRWIERRRKEGEKIRDQEEFYQILLETQNITKQRFLADLKKSIVVEKLLWTRVFPPKEFISPGERREYYHTHRAEFQSPSEIQFRQIFFEPTERSLDLMREVDRALDRGIPFKELADRYSQSPKRGDLWKKKIDEIERWPAPLPRILKKMKPGETRRAIQTSLGIHYVRMEAITLGEVRPFEEVQEEIERRIIERRNAERRESFIETLKGRFVVQNFLPPLKPEQTSAAESGAGKKPSAPVADVSPDPTRPAGKKKQQQPKKKE